MARAYDEVYLQDVRETLGELFDYAINDCKLMPLHFVRFFYETGYSKYFEEANTQYISGKSAIEIAQDIFYEVGIENKLKKEVLKEEFTKEYWLGYQLAYYQWLRCISYKELFEKLDIKELLNMYYLYHEEDEMNFVEAIDDKLTDYKKETNLKRLRESLGYSQSELSRLSGVGLRNIQLYEQRVNDINKANVETVFALSLILKCDVTDLMEFPIKK